MSDHELLRECRVCQGKVALGVKQCPHCGVANPAKARSMSEKFKSYKHMSARDRFFFRFKVIFNLLFLGTALLIFLAIISSSSEEGESINDSPKDQTAETRLYNYTKWEN